MLYFSYNSSQTLGFGFVPSGQTDATNFSSIDNVNLYGPSQQMSLAYGNITGWLIVWSNKQGNDSDIKEITERE